MLGIDKIYNKSITICFSFNNAFFEYLVVCIHSILKNANKTDNYDIVILDNGITETNKEILKKYESEKVSIRFYNMSEILKQLDVNFYINFHFSVECYFRLFIPHIFRKYEKVLYLDCDAVCLSDIAEIYNQDLGDNMIGAAKDFMVMNQILSGYKKEYFQNELGLKNELDYVNTGVTLWNIRKLIDFKFVEKSLELMKKFKPLYVDQCIINKILEGRIKFLDSKYNASSALEELCKNLSNTKLTKEMVCNYRKSLENPCFLHYMSKLKPWKFPDMKNADVFWKYARETEVYERIIYKNTKQPISEPAVSKEMLKDIFEYHKNKFKYWRYKLLSKITFGKKRKKYKQKKKDLKQRLKAVRSFLKVK